jgi:alcohol dehydrogenase
VVATCDLDDLIVSGTAPFPPPFALGHEGVAEVVEVGDAVTGVRPGDRVVVPFQISCGSCGACGASRTGNCTAYALATTYGFGFGPEATRFGGFLTDRVAVPHADAMLVRVPDAVTSQAAASVSDNMTDAYRAVGPHLATRPGAPVLIVGGAGSGSIPLYATGMACALGSREVLYIDRDPAHRAVAEGYGARTLDTVPERLERRFPITVDGSGSTEGLRLAVSSLGRDGVCTGVTPYFDESIVPPFPLLSMYVMSTTFITGRIHARADMPAVLDLLASGTFDPTPVTSHVVDFDDAADALLAHEHTKLLFVR